MNKDFERIIQKIDDKGLKNVKVLALITETSFDVQFYANNNGKMEQSNTIAEQDPDISKFINDTYKEIALTAKKDKRFDSNKLNVITIDSLNDNFTYQEKSFRVYSIKKAWKQSIKI